MIADDDCHFRKVVYIFKDVNGTTVSFFFRSDAKGGYTISLYFLHFCG